MDETHHKKTFFILLYIFPQLCSWYIKKYTVISYKCVCIGICFFVRLLKYLGLKCKWVEFIKSITSRDERKKVKSAQTQVEETNKIFSLLESKYINKKKRKWDRALNEITLIIKYCYFPWISFCVVAFYNSDIKNHWQKMK